ncbi:ATP-citrate synthase-like [Rhinopithecus roxellana]|uniref:ATP-citrate synthase-like n=1 Tax=Rhinopithecus roxellana TaxID=61622 RepID=UPI0012372D70|nr:ATP-citrate synthase-like [Rhinopithecus roxellana]
MTAESMLPTKEKEPAIFAPTSSWGGLGRSRPDHATFLGCGGRARQRQDGGCGCGGGGGGGRGCISSGAGDGEHGDGRCRLGRASRRGPRQWHRGLRAWARDLCNGGERGRSGPRSRGFRVQLTLFRAVLAAERAATPGPLLRHYPVLRRGWRPRVPGPPLGTGCRHRVLHAPALGPVFRVPLGTGGDAQVELRAGARTRHCGSRYRVHVHRAHPRQHGQRARGAGVGRQVQFGHAGACANQASETAVAKNQALKEVGVFVPRSFDELGEIIQSVYEDLVANGVIVPAQEVPPPTVPMDYSWARELGLIRKPASFMTSICDERGQELIYAGMPITEVFKEEMGIGGVLGLLWFQKRLPKYSCQFIEMCLMVTADHGPAVSGAHNTIICARAGKDLVSSLTSGLLTIGDRFGGALDAAAKMFSKAFDSGIIPMEFVNKMKKEGKLIMGIGHRVKSINNPDMRVQILKDYVRQHFPATPLLDYALEVEKITTSKKPNLILNVDGLIGVAFVDMLRNCGSFTREEADEYIDIGALNGIFVLGRSMGFIGHYLDQKRLKQGLYRHPWDDISYVLPEHMSM